MTELPGEPPYTRGIHPEMYGHRLWTMRQYAGFGTAAETNSRFHSLLAAGQTGLSVAFDLPTQLGMDSDDPRATGEVGRVGVAIDSLDDMRALMKGISLDQVTTSMTINATATLLVLLYELVAEEQGVSGDQLRGTVQNDILKEYIARGTYIYPPGPSLRLTSELLSYCGQRLPQWNSISISGYHMREAGSTAVQELAFTFANAIAYVRAAQDSGMTVDSIGPRLSFFFNSQMDLLEEVAKFRAARRLWFRIATEIMGATDERTPKLRFHVQTAGSALTAQQPDVNIVRVTVQALSAIFGGAQSLHTNAYDEALGLPSERAATLALRTQQVLGFESGIPAIADPFGGSYEIEKRTDALESAAWEELHNLEQRGGAVACIEEGYQQRAIEEAASAHARSVDSGERVVVGVNRFVEDVPSIRAVPVDPAGERDQVAALALRRAARAPEPHRLALEAVEAAAAGTGPVIPSLRWALQTGATIGEVSDALRRQWGEHTP